MRRFLMVLSLLLVVVISACNNNDEFAGQTMDFSLGASEKEYMFTMVFLEGGKVVGKSGELVERAGGLEGTYEYNNNTLTINLEKEGEKATFTFNNMEKYRGSGAGNRYMADPPNILLTTEDGEQTVSLNEMFGYRVNAYKTFIESQ